MWFSAKTVFLPERLFFFFFFFLSLEGRREGRLGRLTLIDDELAAVVSIFLDHLKEIGQCLSFLLYPSDLGAPDGCKFRRYR
jgi:hypothetical protein